MTGAVRPSSRAWTELLHAEVAYALSSAGIPVLHIKGPTVALWLYAEGERPWGDVDVLVPPSRMHDALAVLGARGMAERWAGVNRRTTEDHAVTVAHTDPAKGADEVDVHDRFPGIDLEAERAFELLWRRREPAQLAHTDVWFPDLSTRALLIVLNTARTAASPRTLADLERVLDAGSGVDWEDILALAGRLDALPALRAGLELDAAGRDLIAATSLSDVTVSTEWLLRRAGAPRTALRMDELRRSPLRQRPARVAHWLFPSVGVLQMRDPRAVGGPVAVAVGYARRWVDGIRSVPSAVRGLRAVSHPDASDRRDEMGE